MLKLLRLLANIVLFFAVAFAVSVVQVGSFDLLAAQSPDVEAIHISADDEHVGYIDSYVFWGTDIGTGVVNEPKSRVRNWTDAEWWIKGTKWADYTVDTTIAIFKPILVPIAQINAIREFYGMTIDDLSVGVLDGYKDTEAANNALYELYYINDYGYGKADEVHQITVDDKGNAIISDKLLSDWVYTGTFEAEGYDEVTYVRWTDSNKKLANYTWKLYKYNCGSYDKFFKKFIQVDSTGSRHIKPAVIVLYYQNIVSLIVAGFFVARYPINFFQVRVEDANGSHPRHRRHRRSRADTTTK